jgi:ABC-type Mn2+/Zn2+ transport system ATPase subunit
MAIIAICFRLTLTSILTNTAEFIILDEPLQCVHSSNISKIQDMLALMPSLYKFVFLISHTEALTEMIDLPIKINTNNDSSYIGVQAIKLEPLEKIIPQDSIYCDICEKMLKKRSYALHISSAAHLKLVS